MHLLRRAFQLVRPAAASKRRISPARSKRLQIESLEIRSMLSTSPFYISDETFVDVAKTQLAFQPQDVHIALYGQDYTAQKNYYYFDKDGNANSTGTSGTVPTFLLSDLQYDPAHSAYVINLPQELGGIDQGIQAARMYFAMGPAGAASLHPSINNDGSVNAPKANTESYLDFVEFSLNAPKATPEPGNLDIDTTNVDQFGIPFKVTLDSSDPNNLPNGIGAEKSRDSIITQFQTFAAGTDFAGSVWPTSGSHGPYRLLSPAHVLSQEAIASTIVKVQTILQEDIVSGQTHILVNNSVAGFPNPAEGSFPIQIESEQMTVTSGVDNHDGTTTWEVQRPPGGGSAHAQGKIVTVPAFGAISATQTNLAVGGNLGFPSTTGSFTPFTIIIDSEVMLVTAVLGENTGTPIWQVQRGYYGTQATTHNNGGEIYYYSVQTNPLNDYFNAAIDDVFKAGRQLTLTSNETNFVYTGTLVQEHLLIDDVSYDPYVLRFTSDQDQQDGEDVWYDVYYPFFKDNAYFWGGADHQPVLSTSLAPPWLADAHVQSTSPSEMVFANDGVFADNTWRPENPDLHFWDTDTQNKVLADLEDQVVSALNRGVGALSSSDWQNTGSFYKPDGHGNVWNDYAQFLHEDTVSIDGKNYGFAFDDQTGQASDIGVASFNSAKIVLGPWGADPGPGPDPNPHPHPDPGDFSQRSFLASTEFGSEPPSNSHVQSFFVPSTTPSGGSSNGSGQAAHDAAILSALSTPDESDDLDHLAHDQANQQPPSNQSAAGTHLASGVPSMRSLLSSRGR